MYDYVVVNINSNFGKEFRSLLWHHVFKVRKQCISCFALEPCIVTANKAKVVGREVNYFKCTKSEDPLSFVEL